VTSHGEVLNTIIRHDGRDGRYKIYLRDSRFPTHGAELAVARPERAKLIKLEANLQISIRYV
jgi:hypothetical protein